MARHPVTAVYGDVDEDTAALIYQLQLEDTVAISAAATGDANGQDRVISDSDLALQLFKEDLRKQALIISDRKIATRLAARPVERGYLGERREQIYGAPGARVPFPRATASSVNPPGGPSDTVPATSSKTSPVKVNAPSVPVVLPQDGKSQLHEWQSLPAQLVADDKAADKAYEEQKRICGQVNPDDIKQPVYKETFIQTSAENEGRRTGFRSTTNINPDGTEDEIAKDNLKVIKPEVTGSVEQIFAAEPSDAAPTVWCVSCQDNVPAPETVNVPCYHNYCQTCLNELFRLAMVDESLFPPRCCSQKIPLKDVRHKLSEEFIEKYPVREEEMETSNRTYCSNIDCSTFISLKNIVGEEATCQVCNTQTCKICKNGAHEKDCPDDSDTKALRELAKKSGWQECYSCGLIVELTVGCNQMRCRCGKTWCYKCGTAWKKCLCPQWIERLLYTRANEVADQHFPQPGVTRGQLVEAVAASIRDHCDHGDFRYSHGSWICEMCSDHMPVFTMQCGRCPAQFCRRWTLNRV